VGIIPKPTVRGIWKVRSISQNPRTNFPQKYFFK